MEADRHGRGEGGEREERIRGGREAHTHTDVEGVCLSLLFKLTSPGLPAHMVPQYKQ